MLAFVNIAPLNLVQNKWSWLNYVYSRLIYQLSASCSSNASAECFRRTPIMLPTLILASQLFYLLTVFFIFFVATHSDSCRRKEPPISDALVYKGLVYKREHVECFVLIGIKYGCVCHWCYCLKCFIFKHLHSARHAWLILLSLILHCCPFTCETGVWWNEQLIGQWLPWLYLFSLQHTQHMKLNHYVA